MSGLPLRPADQRAYGQVFSHELLLRRLLRWELRGEFGSRWYGQLGSHAAAIEDRIQVEKGRGLYEPEVSELAYLGLADLADIICQLQWDPIFGKIFPRHGLPKHVLKQGFRKVVSMRNKVAHFRPALNYQPEEEFLRQFVDSCQRYYQRRLEAVVHLSGDPSKSGDQFGTPELRALRQLLADQQLNTVWEEYGRLEHIRAHGLSPGLGIVDRHMFYEIYVEGSFEGDRITAWANKERHAVTFVTVGRYANYVRAFVPLRFHPSDITKVMRGLASVARLSGTGVWKSDEDVKADFDFGVVEWLNGEAHNMFLGFVF